MNTGPVRNPFSRFLSLWVTGLNGIGSVLIFALMLLICLDVLLRYLFNSPVEGVTEMVELSIVCIVFLQISDAISKGRLTRSDGLFKKILARSPRSGHVLGMVFEMAGAVFFSAILYGSLPRLAEAWRGGYFTGNVGIFTFPVWPVRLVLVIGCITAIAVFIQMALRHWYQFRDVQP